MDPRRQLTGHVGAIARDRVRPRDALALALAENLRVDGAQQARRVIGRPAQHHPVHMVQMALRFGQVGDPAVDVQRTMPVVAGQVDRGEDAGDGAGGQQHRHQVALVVVRRTGARERRGGHPHRRGEVLQLRHRHPGLDQVAQAVGGEQVGVSLGEMGQPGPGATGEHVPGGQAKPALRELVDPADPGLPAHEGGVEGSDRRTDEAAGADAGLHQGLDHADLDGSAGGAAGEDEDVSGLVRLLGHGTSLCLAPDPESLPGCRGESSNACPI